MASTSEDKHSLECPTPTKKIKLEDEEHRVDIKRENFEEEGDVKNVEIKTENGADEDYIKDEATALHAEIDLKGEDVEEEEILEESEEEIFAQSEGSGQSEICEGDEPDCFELEDHEFEEEDTSEGSSNDEDEEYFERRHREEVQKMLDSLKPRKHEIKGTKVEISETDILQFNIHLIRGGGAPKIWRRFQVPASYTFRQFHVAIQKAMGWKSDRMDYHLHVFKVVNPSTGYLEAISMKEDLGMYNQFGDDPKENDENLTKIKDFFFVLNHKGRYTYDYGMDWEHEFVLEKVLSPQEGVQYPRCTAGAKACPPEDGAVHSDEEYDSDKFEAGKCFSGD